MSNRYLEILLDGAEILQKRFSSNLFKIYNKFYQMGTQRIFKSASVSLIFRISLNQKNLKNNFDEYFENSKFNETNYDKDFLVKNSINLFEENLKSYLQMEYENTNLNYFNKKALDVKKIKSYFERKIYFSEINNKINQNTQRELLEIIYNNLESEILFVKRATNKKDKYSGNIAFPGGRVEKSDKNTLNASIRETFEEIGINLENLNSKEILGFYLCPNTGFDVTIDFKNIVNSHIFMLIDFNKEIENLFKVQETEISEAFFVPIKYFYELDYNDNKGFFRYFNTKVFGRNCKVQKIVLNDNENFLFWGLTQRIFLRFLRLSNKDQIKFEELVIFNSSFLENYLSRMVRYLMGFFSDAYNTFRLLKVLILISFIYKGMDYLYFKDENKLSIDSKF